MSIRHSYPLSITPSELCPEPIGKSKKQGQPILVLHQALVMHLGVAKYLLDIIPPLPSRWPCTVPATAPVAPWLISSASLASSLPCHLAILMGLAFPIPPYPASLQTRASSPWKAYLKGSAHACLTLKKLLERENRAGPLITLLVDRVPQRFPRVRTHHQKRTMAARRMTERKMWAQWS